MAYVTGGKLIDAGDMSADISSDILVLDNSNDIVAIQAIAASDDHVGSLKVYGSTDGTNWVDIESVQIDAAAGLSLNQLRNLPLLGFKYLKSDYARTSGSGTLTVIMSVQQVRG